MSEEISKRTVTVLVVLAVLISVLGTLTVLNEVRNINTARYYSQSVSDKGSSTGQVSLGLTEKISGSSEATGRVVFGITEPEKTTQETRILLLPEKKIT